VAARACVVCVSKPAPPCGWVDLWLLVRRYGITHAVAGDPVIDARLPMLFAVRKASTGARWKIEGERPGLVMIDDAHPAAANLGLNAMLLVTNDGPIDAAHAPARTPDQRPSPRLLGP